MIKNQESKATCKHTRLSAHKTRRILEQIKGRKCQEALLMLKFMPHKPCETIQKVIKSAVSNAKNKNISDDDLVVVKAIANQGPKLKRFQPRAQGRAFSIHKPTCHITIAVGTLS
uniref:Large ribosomal subunit protein uL22c n=1 Tax=Rhodymenia pseudopalmata TaxID=31502 RepID=A0A1C9C7W9_RHOPU|nr:ribosomal protein L22 [Rhodymenia pseudopalmata]AOM64474.1 ribosomal protein L22 [Rhodymenia pseudopalmata]